MVPSRSFGGPAFVGAIKTKNKTKSNQNKIKPNILILYTTHTNTLIGSASERREVK